MILVYKFDFVFIQNIKISLINLPCEGGVQAGRKMRSAHKVHLLGRHWKGMVQCSCADRIEW